MKIDIEVILILVEAFEYFGARLIEKFGLFATNLMWVKLKVDVLELTGTVHDKQPIIKCGYYIMNSFETIIQTGARLSLQRYARNHPNSLILQDLVDFSRVMIKISNKSFLVTQGALFDCPAEILQHLAIELVGPYVRTAMYTLFHILFIILTY